MHGLNQEQIDAALKPAWLLNAFMSIGLATIIIICQAVGDEFVTQMAEQNRIMLRTALYMVAIIVFPLTNLLRHIQLRLNQTMPTLNHDPLSETKKRYFATVVVSLSLINSMGMFGLVMFILGDGFNTLYIFLAMSALGLFLYRPKANEFLAVFDALNNRRFN